MALTKCINGFPLKLLEKVNEAVLLADILADAALIVHVLDASQNGWLPKKFVHVLFLELKSLSVIKITPFNFLKYLPPYIVKERNPGYILGFTNIFGKGYNMYRNAFQIRHARRDIFREECRNYTFCQIFIEMKMKFEHFLSCTPIISHNCTFVK